MNKTALLFFSALTFLSAATPDSFTQIVKYKSETFTVDLVKESIRGTHFELKSFDSLGVYKNETVDPEIYTYLGTVREDPTAMVAGIIRPSDGTFRGKIYRDRGFSLFVEGDTVVATRGVSSEKFNYFNSSVAPGAAGKKMYEFTLALECTNAYFKQSNESLTTLLENIEYSVIQLRAMYMNNALLAPALGRIIVRTAAATDTLGATASPLSAFKTHWNTKQTDAVRQVAAMIIPNYGGGLAYVNTAGTASGYSINGTDDDGSFDILLRHEMGHNWGPSDNHSNRSEDATIMCGNSNGRFSGPGVATIFARRNAILSKLVDLGRYTHVQIPPYAALDVASIPRDGDTVRIAVLANDFDANGDSLTLAGFDSLSAQGARIIVSPENAQELLLISANSPESLDYFRYTVEDSAGKRATGVVLVEYLPAGTVSYEAEDAQFTGAKTQTWYTGFSGTGYLEKSDLVTYGVTWNATPRKAGLTTVAFRYSLGGSTAVPMLLTVDGVPTDTISFDTTGDWDVWRTVTIDLEMNGSMQAIKLTPLGTLIPNMDKLSLWDGVQISDGVYEAENAVYTGSTKETWFKGYLGTGYVEFKDSATYDLTWTVNRKVEGPNTISFRYAQGDVAGSVRKLLLTVDATVVDTIEFGSTGSWSVWDTVNVSHRFTAGTHTVKLTAVASKGANIDRLLLIPEEEQVVAVASPKVKSIRSIRLNALNGTVQFVNPTNTVMTLTLWDLRGREIATLSSSAAVGTLPVSSLGKSIYLYQIRMGGTAITGRVMIR